jgi:uncharacterized membrane protein
MVLGLLLEWLNNKLKWSFFKRQENAVNIYLGSLPFWEFQSLERKSKVFFTPLIGWQQKILYKIHPWNPNSIF